MNDEIKIAGVAIPVVEPEGLDGFLVKLRGPKCMKRDRSYSGQPHTFYGERGRTQVKGLSIRDIEDCLVRAIFLSAPHLVPESYEEAIKGEDAELNSNDLYGFDLDKLDPVAVMQNLACEIERLMGIYPNVPETI